MTRKRSMRSENASEARKMNGIARSAWHTSNAGNLHATYLSNHYACDVETYSSVSDIRTEMDPNQDKKIRLNVGGMVFMTLARTLWKVPGTRLSCLTESDRNFDSERGEFFFDRNPLVFQGVLEYYRTGELHIPETVCAPVMRRELHFWGIDQRALSECCWHKFKKCDDTIKSIKKIRNAFKNFFGVPTTPLNSTTWWQRLKRNVWNVLEYPRSSNIAKMWMGLSTVMILISVFISVFESLPTFRVSTEPIYPDFVNITTNPKQVGVLTTELHPALIYLELISSAVFTIDLFLRLIFCPKKWAFFKSPFTWFEVLALSMVWLVTAFYTVIPPRSSHELHVFNVCLCLRNLRVLRIFYIAKHFSVWRILVLSLRTSITEILSLLTFVLTGVLVFSVLIYSAQFWSVDKFENVPIGFWWAVVTMTTVGYGDLFPTTVPGYLVGATCALCGMLATGLPIPIIASNFHYLHVTLHGIREYDRQRRTCTKHTLTLQPSAKEGNEKNSKLLTLTEAPCLVNNRPKAISNDSSIKGSAVPNMPHPTRTTRRKRNHHMRSEVNSTGSDSSSTDSPSTAAKSSAASSGELTNHYPPSDSVASLDQSEQQLIESRGGQSDKEKQMAGPAILDTYRPETRMTQPQDHHHHHFQHHYPGMATSKSAESDGQGGRPPDGGGGGSDGREQETRLKWTLNTQVPNSLTTNDASYGQPDSNGPDRHTKDISQKTRV